MLVISVLAGALNNVSAQGDSFSDAEEITPGTYSGEVNETNPEDYWKINLDSSSIITVNFTAEEPADLRLRLWEPDRETEAFRLESKNGATKSSDYYLAYETDPDYWYIQVDNDFGTYGNYTFDVEVTSQNDAESGEDAPESFTDALEVGEGEHSGIIRDLDEVDTYKVDLEGDQIINLDFTAEEPAELELKFYDQDENDLFTLESSSGATESGDYALSNGTEPDYWYIEVDNDFGTYGDYTFDIQLTEQDDAGSGGDAAGAAPGPSLPENPTPISAGSFSGYMNEPGDVRDIYGMDLSSGSTMNVTVNPSSSIAVDTWLFNDGYDELASDNGNSPGEESEVTYTPTSDEFIYVWLNCQDGDGTYDIDVDVEGTVEGTIIVDGDGEVILESYNEESGVWEEHPDSPVEDQLTDQTSAGTQVRLTADPDQGWEFSEWTGDETGTDNPIEFTRDEDKTITANFEETTTETYTLTVNTDGDGSVDIDPDQSEYHDGETVKLTAVPEQGWEFSEWTGDEAGTSDEITITMDEDKTVTANFEETTTETYTLTVNTDGDGSVDIDPDQAEYHDGETVKLTANPDEGYEFDEWTGDAAGTSDEITITMDEDKTITANFEEETTNGGDYPDFIQEYIEKGMWCFALLIIIPILIIIVIIVVLVKLLKGGDSGGKQPPQQQQQPPQQQSQPSQQQPQQPPQQQPPQDQGGSDENPPPPPPEDD